MPARRSRFEGKRCAFAPCGNVITRRPDKRKYCSRACVYNQQRGQVYSDSPAARYKRQHRARKRAEAGCFST